MLNLLHKPNPKRSSGFTMVEVLITVVVVSIGLLGLAGLQISGLRANMGSEARSKATILANDIAERMHANPLAIDQYDGITTAGQDCETEPDRFCSSYNDGTVTTLTDGTTTTITPAAECTPTQMSTFDAWVWTCGLPVATGVQRGGVINKLTNGTASVTCNTNPCVEGSARTISVSWDVLNPNRESDPDTAVLTQTYSLVVVPLHEYY